MSLLGVCLMLAAGAASEPVFIPVTRFTLAWTHSIEKQRWEEDYEVRAAAAPGQAPRLLARSARIRGSGAGMEPPPGSVLRDGWYHYTPARAEHTELLLTRSAFAADYEWCEDGRCRALAEWLPSDGGVTRLWACSSAAATGQR